VKSAIRAYAEIFLLGPKHHPGIPACESSQFRRRAHVNILADRSLHDLHILTYFHSRGWQVSGHGMFRRDRVALPQWAAYAPRQIPGTAGIRL